MKKWSVVIILAFAQFVMVLDSTVMNVSISTIVQDLNTSVEALQGAITFYTLTMAAFMLIGAKLCAKWGLTKAFIFGSIIYGIGSFLTGIAPNITTLFVGWSVIEGLGAVLVIPAIAALVAINYKGKDRVTAYAIIGGVSGAAAAAGPLIGGFMTTYLSWRYVFIAETIIMIGVILLSRKFKSSKGNSKEKIDILSAVLSASGMILLVFGLLQSKTWGWITPIVKPVVAGYEIAPFGISIVAYLIIFGFILLKLFYDRQIKLKEEKQPTLVDVTLLNIQRLRSGLGVLTSQYMITAAVFFIVPVFLQMVLGLNALQTGIKILPLSVALIIFSMLGARFASKYNPKQITRFGQILLVFGSFSLLFAIGPELTGIAFGLAMFAVGSGLGLLASQLGNVNMGSVDESKTSDVGGLQGTFQNLGSSLGTALIGSVLLASLTTGFVNNVNNSDLDQNIKEAVEEVSATGISIVPAQSVEDYALSKGLSESEAQELSDEYTSAQVESLRRSVFFLVIISIFSIFISRGIPSKNDFAIKRN